MEIEKNRRLEQQIDHISKDIRGNGLLFMSFAFFCLLTLMQPDSSFYSHNAEVKLPFAGGVGIYTNIFLVVGPLLVSIIAIYQHIFIRELIRKSDSSSHELLPYVFTLKDRVSIIISNIIFFFLPSCLLGVFAFRSQSNWAYFSLVFGAILILCSTLYTINVALEVKKAEEKRGIIFKLILTFFAISVVVISVCIKNNRVMDFSGEDLRKFNFQDMEIGKVDFSSSDLTGANFKGKNLSKVYFNNAVLDEVNFQWVKIICSDMGEAKKENEEENENRCNKVLEAYSLVNANFQGATIEKQDFTNLKLDGIRFSGVNLVGNRISDVSFKDADLKGVDFSTQSGAFENMHFDRADLTNAIFGKDETMRIKGDGFYFMGTDLTKAKFKNVDIESLWFDKNTVLHMADFSYSNLKSARFIGSDLRNTKFENAKVENSEFSEDTKLPKDLTCVNLSGSMFIGVDFSGVNLQGAILIDADLSKSIILQSQLDSAIGNDATIIPNNLIKPERWLLANGSNTEDVCEKTNSNSK